MQTSSNLAIRPSQVAFVIAATLCRLAAQHATPKTRLLAPHVTQLRAALHPKNVHLEIHQLHVPLDRHILAPLEIQQPLQLAHLVIQPKLALQLRHALLVMKLQHV